MPDLKGKPSIAYIIESLGPGGAERQLVELIKHLDRERFDVRVLTYVPDNFFRPELERLDVPVWGLIRRGRWDLRPMLQLVHWLRSGEVDLVHAYTTASKLYAVLAGKLARQGQVVVSERANVLRYAGLYRLYGPWTYRHADLVIVNSNSTRTELLAHLNLDSARTLFISNGLDMDEYSPVDDETRQALRQRLGWPPSQRILLTVASFKEPKNHFGILDALEGFEAARSPLRFYWVGEPAPPDRFAGVRERIVQLGLVEVIHVLGLRSDVVELYQACDLLLLNSLWEGTPNVILEALACGRPVIATDVSDVSRYVLPGRTGWLVPPGNSDALRRVLDQVAQTSNEKLKEMGANGRQHLVELGIDSESLARRHEQAYLKLVKMS